MQFEKAAAAFVIGEGHVLESDGASGTFRSPRLRSVRWRIFHHLLLGQNGESATPFGGRMRKGGGQTGKRVDRGIEQTDIGQDDEQAAKLERAAEHLETADSQ